jgi:hypothetical protein
VPQLSVFELLQRAARDLVVALDADACAVSRALGDVLVQVAEHAPDGRTFHLGRGFLVSQFPTTDEVLRGGGACAVSLGDPDADPAETAVLRDLDVGAVLMLTLRGRDAAWGLVELYRADPATFDATDIRRAEAIVARAEPVLVSLLR